MYSKHRDELLIINNLNQKYPSRRRVAWVMELL